MTREEFNKILNSELENNAHAFAEELSSKENKEISYTAMVAAAYTHAVSDATKALATALEKAGYLKYDN